MHVTPYTLSQEEPGESKSQSTGYWTYIDEAMRPRKPTPRFANRSGMTTGALGDGA